MIIHLESKLEITAHIFELRTKTTKLHWGRIV